MWAVRAHEEKKFNLSVRRWVRVVVVGGSVDTGFSTVRIYIVVLVVSAIILLPSFLLSVSPW